MVIATVVLFLANTALSTVVTIAWARGRAAGDSAARLLLFDPGTLSGRAARVRLLGVALLRHLPLRFGPASPLADRAPGLHLHRAAVRGRQAALRSLSRPLRVGRRRCRATPTSARRCCSFSGSTTRRSSSCSAAWSPRPGSCVTCRSGSASSWADRSAGRLPHVRRYHAPSPTAVAAVAGRRRAACAAGRRARRRSPPARAAGRRSSAADHRGHPRRRHRRSPRPERGRRGGVAAHLPARRAACCRPTPPPFEGREAIQKFWGGLLDAYRVNIAPSSADEIGGPRRPGLRPRALHAGRHAQGQGTPPLPRRGQVPQISAASRTAAGAMPWTCTAPTCRCQVESSIREAPGIYSWCLRSEGRRRVNRVRTSPVAALSDARCRFGEPEALFFSLRP